MPARRTLPPTHPGSVLREELRERGLSLNELSRAIRIPQSRVSLIANEKRSVTAETALRLARYFGMSPEFWMNLQTSYDLAIAKQKSAARIAREVLLPVDA